VAAGIGGKSIGPLILDAVTNFYARSEWNYRRAAIAAMSRLAEGSSQYFKSYLPATFDILNKAVFDPSFIVQYEAIQMIGRLAVLYADKTDVIVNNYVPVLSSKLSDASVCDRIRGHAASALINILNPETCDDEQLEPYLQPLLQSLCNSLQSAAVEIQSPCLTLLGCAAQVSVEGFKPFYSLFMPGIKHILHNATSEQFIELRGKAMQCVGLIGEAVGDEIFAPDAIEIMQLLISAIGTKENDIDSEFDYILPACARISKALGSKFEPFLPFVMNPIFTGASQDIQFSMVDANDEDEGDAEHDEETGIDSAVINLGAGVKKRVTLNTHAVQQKSQAANLLYEFAKNMKGNLKAYLSPCLDLLLVLVTDKHSGDIRSSASLGIGAIFEALVDGTQQGFLSLEILNNAFNSCVSKLLESLKGEVRSNTRACSAESLRDVLAACYESGVESPDGSRGPAICSPDLSQATYLSAEILERCGESLNRRSERMKLFESNEALEQEDKNQFADEIEEEEDLLSNLVDALGQILKLHGENFMNIFDSTISSKFAPFLSSSHPESLQIIAICLIDDALEFGGKAAQKYVPQA